MAASRRVIRYDLRGEEGDALRPPLHRPSLHRLVALGRRRAARHARRRRRSAPKSPRSSAPSWASPAARSAVRTKRLPSRRASLSRSRRSPAAPPVSRAPCVANTDAAGRLALRLSELAGSRTEEELARAAVAELLDADRAFAAKAQADGVPAAFNALRRRRCAHRHQPRNRSAAAPASPRATRLGPQGARLEWAPETGRVSARGDMGWTWGNSTYIAPDGARTPAATSRSGRATTKAIGATPSTRRSYASPQTRPQPETATPPACSCARGSRCDAGSARSGR